MKKLAYSGFTFVPFLPVLSLVIALNSSCSKKDREDLNEFIFFEAKYPLGRSDVNYGLMINGRRPADIGSSAIKTSEIIGTNGEVSTVIFVSVSAGILPPSHIQLGVVSSLMQFIKPGKEFIGVYHQLYKPPMGNSLLTSQISWGANIFSITEFDNTFVIERTGISDTFGSYAEGFYSVKGVHYGTRNDTIIISGKFRLYLAQ